MKAYSYDVIAFTALHRQTAVVKSLQSWLMRMTKDNLRIPPT